MKTKILPALAFALGTSFGLSSVRADDWPQWMGPSRDGTYLETGIIDEIPASGLEIKWRTPIAGGYSGPAVQGDRVVVMDYLKSEGEAVNNPGERASLQGDERIHCLDAKTGEILWTHAYSRPYQISYPAGPRCTPTIDDQTVYCLGAEGDLLALNLADGKLLWQKSFTNDYGAPVPIWGHSAHPLVDGNLLICMIGGPGQTVVAFDKRTGAEVWKALSASAVGYCPPSIIEAGGKRQLIVFHADGLASLDPATGSLYWEEPLKPSYEMTICRPQRDGDLLYASGIGEKSLMLRLASDRPAVEEVWAEESRDRAVYCANSTPILFDGVIYGADCGSGKLIAVDEKSGERLWSTFQATNPINDRRVNHGTAFLTRIGDRILAFSETGDLLIFACSREGYQEFGRFHVLEPTGECFGRKVVWSHPAYAQRTAFIRNDKEIVAVSLSAPAP